MNDDKTIDLASIRARLAGTEGKHYWQSLEELADSPSFQALVHREFPAQASEWLDPRGRRGFLKLMGASIALAGATACTRQPDELLVPYVRQPEEVVPGRPLFFATAMTLGGIATGLLAESHVGRPTKLEGNPEHPSSLGATDLLAQASVLTMYDPDRSRAITYLGEVRPWASFTAAMQSALGEVKALGGTGVHFLSETTTSPTLAAQFAGVLAGLPSAKWHQYDPVSPDGVHQGGMLAFGAPVDVHYKLEQAQAIVALDADLFGAGTPGNVRYARDFASGRRVRRARAEMNRLYVAEPTPTATGSVADHRQPLKASQVDAVARAILAGVQGGAPGSLGSKEVDGFVGAAVKDLLAARGRGVLAVGSRQPAAVHAVAHAINHALGNVGTTVVVTDPLSNGSSQVDGLKSLVQDLNAGTVRLLVILGGNPVFNAPADLKFGDALRKARTRVHVGLFDDETAAQCHWHINSTHFLEEWSDARAHDGTASIVQPLIAPLYRGKSFHEVVAVFSDRPVRTGYDLVREDLAVAARVCRRGVREGLAQGRSRRRDCGHRARTHGGGRPGRAVSAGCSQRGLRGSVCAGPDDPRRSLRQQRLVAGTPQAADEADVGQRRVDGAVDRAGAWRRQRRPRVGHGERPLCDRAGIRSAGSRRRCRHGLLRLRAHARGPGRHGRGLRRLRDSHG